MSSPLQKLPNGIAIGTYLPLLKNRIEKLSIFSTPGGAQHPTPALNYATYLYVEHSRPAKALSILDGRVDQEEPFFRSKYHLSEVSFLSVPIGATIVSVAFEKKRLFGQVSANRPNRFAGN